MHTKEKSSAAVSILDKRRLQALGILLQIKLKSITFLPGRHPLGRAGEGMRFLRTRPYEPGEDKPRDIDKFSLPGKYWVNEWEAEVRASVLLLCDYSGSMAFPPKDAVRNLSLLQLTYSLWRASDRVRTILYSKGDREKFEEANLKTQMEKLSNRLAQHEWSEGEDALDALQAYCLRSRGNRDDLIFLMSDFSTAMEHASTSEWRSVLRRLSGGLVPVIVSFKMSDAVMGSIKLWDPVRQTQRLTFLTPKRIDNINQKEMDRVLKLESFFRSLGLDYLIVRHERDVYPQLAKLKGLRRRRRS
ncbi:MAG: hypothetical protein ACI9XC_001307 [Gammaproteobacteria bacterium]|jgi:uncharacterized protein (DUF58 family)